jgi:hypothetical protein
MVICKRCSIETHSHKLSMFNTDELCLQCKADEVTAPGYAHAAKVEAEEVMKGNMNYEGVGLSMRDIEYLASLRASRTKLAS